MEVDAKSQLSTTSTRTDDGLQLSAMISEGGTGVGSEKVGKPKVKDGRTVGLVVGCQTMTAEAS